MRQVDTTAGQSERHAQNKPHPLSHFSHNTTFKQEWVPSLNIRFWFETALTYTFHFGIYLYDDQTLNKLLLNK